MSDAKKSTGYAVTAGGTEKREIKVTEVALALRETGARKGVYVPNTVIKGKLQKQFHLLDCLRRQQARHLTDGVREEPRYLPDRDYIDGVCKTATTAKTLSAELRALEELEIAAREGLNEEQLNRVIDFQLVKRAGEMSPEHAWKFLAQRYNDAVADVLEPAGRKLPPGEQVQ